MLNVINKSRVAYLYNEFVVKMLRDKERKPLLQQVKELYLLAWAIQYWPHNYFKYDGYKKGKSLDEVKLYSTGLLFADFRREHLNDCRYTVFADDKFLFHKLMADSNIRTAKLINVISHNTYRNESIDLNAENVLDSIVARAIVIKPVIDSSQGAGVNVININTNALKKFEISGVTYTSAELLEKIFSESACSYLIEEKIQQHSFNQRLHPESVNTIRVDSLLSKTGEAIINSAYLRIGRNGRKVDNWSGKSGGIGVNINIETGKLSSLGIDYCKNLYSEPPNTGVAFSGLTVPYWDEIINIVKKAALQFPNLKSLGWDIALSENGPLILEVNADYDILAQQTCTQAFGQNTAFYSELINYSKNTKYQKHFAISR
ncbi:MULTISPECIES: sugar-transfer associated ATP-grasp domain-containing protein [unclassified Pseudoalteromonas]|uniref:sugar-transfer associated ATP-grasp domain-containing protein n=1 Tax=unclassified Pseudoalteromonas TaxID=194690 RepID=UPI0004032EDF|nr:MULTISPECIES: sugar-transfer associated ATP-grasp domain-containing protein [unclassified Pseudoalteromonas]